MPYRVQLVPIPTVIDASGNPVPGARVLRIHFPTGTLQTTNGPVSYLTGPGSAEIMIGTTVIANVPLA
jgi:hypothetical protein